MPPRGLHAHADALERAVGPVYAVFATGQITQFWLVLAAAGCSGAGPVAGGAAVTAATVVLAAALLARRRQRVAALLVVQAAAAAVVAPGWLLAAPAGPCGAAVADGTYLLAAPAYAGWAVLAPRAQLAGGALLAAVAVLPAAGRSAALALEQLLFALAATVLAHAAARVLRRAAAAADELGAAAHRDRALAARVEAGAEADRAAARLLHDEVLHALRAVGLAGRFLPVAEVRHQCRVALGALSPSAARPPADDGGPPRDLAAALAAVARDAPPLAVSLRAPPGGRLVPGAVAEAVAAAVRESLRNVVRHAGTGRAEVALQVLDDGGVEVRVRDRGRGFDPSSVPADRLGLARSVRARLADVGGQASVDSRPLAGTAVTLRWSPAAPRPADPSPRGLDWWAGLGFGPGQVLAAYLLPLTVAHVWAAVVHRGELRWPAVALGVVVVQSAVNVACARPAARLRMGPAAGALLAAVCTAGAALGLAAVRPGTEGGFAFWASGFPSAGLATVALLRPAREAVPAVVAYLGTVLAVLTGVGDGLAPGVLLTVLASPLLAAAFGFAHRLSFRRVAGLAAQQVAAHAGAVEALARHRAEDAARRRHLGWLEAGVLPLLRAVGAGTADPAGPRVQEAARLGAAAVRDRLVLPGLVDERLGRVVGAARGRGVAVALAGDGRPLGELAAPVRALLCDLLDGASPVAVTDLALTCLSSAGGAHGGVGLVLTAVLRTSPDGAGRARLARLAGPVLAAGLHLDGRHLLLDHDPAPAAAPAPERPPQN